MAAYILSKLTPFLLVWGVREGVWGGGGYFGLEAQNLHVTAMIFFLALRGELYAY